MAEEVAESVTVAGKFLVIIVVDNILKGVVPKPVKQVFTSAVQ